LNRRLPRAGPHKLSARAGAERERHPHRDHRLAGAGLTGEDRQARRRFDLEPIDHTQAGDAQLTEH